MCVCWVYRCSCLRGRRALHVYNTPPPPPPPTSHFLCLGETLSVSWVTIKTENKPPTLREWKSLLSYWTGSLEGFGVRALLIGWNSEREASCQTALDMDRVLDCCFSRVYCERLRLRRKEKVLPRTRRSQHGHTRRQGHPKLEKDAGWHHNQHWHPLSRCLFIHLLFTTTGIHQPLVDPQKLMQQSWKWERTKPTCQTVGT